MTKASKVSRSNVQLKTNDHLYHETTSEKMSPAPALLRNYPAAGRMRDMRRQLREAEPRAGG